MKKFIAVLHRDDRACIMYLVEQVDKEFRIADHITDKAKPVIETTRTQCLMPAWSQIEAEGLNQANAFAGEPIAGNLPQTAIGFGPACASACDPAMA